jgi:tetratricopeptide (TPR) repeat protein
MQKTRQIMLKRFIASAVLYSVCMFSLLFAGCSRAVESPEVKMERARILMQRGRPAEAIPLLNEVSSSDTEDDEVYYQRGVAHEQLDLLDKALEDYSLCLKYAPDRHDALNNKAVVLAKMEKYEEAADEFRKLVESSPEDPLAYRNRALCFADLKRFDNALADYAKAIELAPSDPAGWFQRGNVYLTQKRHEEAIADYTRAIELDGQLSMAFMNRGVAHYRLRQFDAAKKDLEHAQEMDDSIVVPGVDFFGTEGQVPASSASPMAWSGYQAAAEKILAERGFRDVNFTSEFPLLLCAICSASDQNGPRRIVVCGRHPDGSIIIPESAEASDATTAASMESLLILQQDNAGAIAAEKFIDDRSGTPMQPSSRFTQYR